MSTGTITKPVGSNQDLHIPRFTKFLKEKLTMKKKAFTLFLATLTATALLFTGCKNKETETIPVVEESTEEIEATETEEIEPVEEEILDESNEAEGSYENGNPDLVDGTALTQAELDELSKTAVTDAQKEIVDSYKSLQETGKFTDAYGNTYTKAVGKPDGSWRKMSDTEAEKILATADPHSDERYFLADSELKGKDFVVFDTVTGIVYYDPYEYLPVLKGIVQDSHEANGDTTIYTEEDLQKQIDEYWSNNSN